MNLSGLPAKIDKTRAIFDAVSDRSVPFALTLALYNFWCLVVRNEERIAVVLVVMMAPISELTSPSRFDRY